MMTADQEQDDRQEMDILQPLVQLRELLLSQIRTLISTLQEELKDSIHQETRLLHSAREDTRRQLGEQRLYNELFIWAHAEITEFDTLLYHIQGESSEKADAHTSPLMSAITQVLDELNNCALRTLESGEQHMDSYLKERDQLLHEYLSFNASYLGNYIIETFENLSSQLDNSHAIDLNGLLKHALDHLRILHQEIRSQSQKLFDYFSHRVTAYHQRERADAQQRLGNTRRQLHEALQQIDSDSRVRTQLIDATQRAQGKFEAISQNYANHVETQTAEAFQRYLRRLDHAHAHIIGLLQLSETAFIQTFNACRLLLNFKLKHLESSEQNEALSHSLRHDPLTKLYNRVALNDHFPSMLATTLRMDLQLYLLFIDLDGFKAINDSLGHHAGDLLLQQTAQRMQQLCREGDMLCRLAGDEFVILATSANDNLALLADRLVSAIAQPFILTGEDQARVSASIGITQVSPTDNLISAIERADQAMYCAKNNGKNRHCLWRAQEHV